ncbi:PAS domain S-box protein [Catenuloplanes indicus]|uniref:Diguanylate cyclase (GGDEF)-like protein/PAS domain S-box-containing protein n=1 Tax=Catenuloplanes indicus TaxID=137267 RepID=A0AAE4AYB8_9ACTN|nr:PAS domain S-box protein [Catenuloplanes indicus]MDQ0367084.1 diguanylate cyclase (GGDEF)-like protein/PAS domain S-box-containing protein [Catenuloplanes indicus]
MIRPFDRAWLFLSVLLTLVVLATFDVVWMFTDGPITPPEVAFAGIVAVGGTAIVLLALHYWRQRRTVSASARLAAIVEWCDDAVIGLGLNGMIDSWNPAAERIFGYRAEEIIGRHGSLLLAEDDPERALGLLPRIADGEVFLNHEHTYVRKDGRAIEMSASVSPVRDRTGEIVGVAVVGRDITAQAAEHRLLKEQRQRLSRIIETAGDALVSMDEDGAITEWNAAAERTFGWPAARVIGRPLRDVLIQPQDRAAHDTGFARLLRTRVPTLATGDPIRVVARHRDGRDVPVEMKLWITEHNGRMEANAFLRDITAQQQMEAERSRYEARLAHMATHDTLTDLPNRALLMDRLTMALNRTRRTGKTVTLLYLDLDRFKEVNDTLGHAIGDALLTTVASRLRQSVRPSDTVARLGGDEFVILCDDQAKPEDVSTIVSRLTSAVCRPISLPSAVLVPELSIGHANSGDHPTADELLGAADAAMYAHKRGRRPGVLVTDR